MLAIHLDCFPHRKVFVSVLKERVYTLIQFECVGEWLFSILLGFKVYCLGSQAVVMPLLNSSYRAAGKTCQVRTSTVCWRAEGSMSPRR